jgi:outer membrane protein TolC
MISFRKTILVLGVLAGLSARLAADDPLVLTVDKAVEIAVANNLLLKGAAVDLAADERAFKTVWNSFLPSVNGSVGLSYADQLFTDIESTSTGIPGLDAMFASEPWSMTIGVQAQLALNMGLFAGIRATKIDFQAGKLTYEQAHMKLVRDIKKGFYGLIVTLASLDLLQLNIDMAEKRYKQAQANYRAGLIPEVEVLRAQVMYENLKPAFKKAETAYQNQLMMFKFLLGLDLKQEIVIDGTLDTTVYEFDADKLITTLLPSRLELRILDLQILSLEEAKKGTMYQMYSPTVSFNAGWGTQVADPGESANWEEGTFRDNFQFGVTVIVPLDGWVPGSKTDNAVKKFNDNLVLLRQARQMASESARMEVYSIVYGLNNTKSSLGAMEYNLQLARKTWQLTDDAYRVGTRELLDVESAQNELFKAESDVLMEKYNYMAGLLDLEYALSVPLAQVLEVK